MSPPLLLVVVLTQAVPSLGVNGVRSFGLAGLRAAAAPLVALGPADSNGCAHEIVLAGETLGGGPREFCIREAVRVRIDDEALVAVRVDAPHRFEARVRSRVFIYRVTDRRLTPRFLGSGFSSREVTRLFVLDGALGLETVNDTGAPERLRCVFDGFPLVCSELSP